MFVEIRLDDLLRDWTEGVGVDGDVLDIVYVEHAWVQTIRDDEFDDVAVGVEGGEGLEKCRRVFPFVHGIDDDDERFGVVE